MNTPRENSYSPYDRPNQPWSCGLACEGRACSAGPSPRGDCPAAPECTPQREGDRWICNRSALRGGPCETGPSPEGECACVQRCTPVRSLRTQRARFVAACFLLATLALLSVLNAPWRNEVIAPGPLTSEHAQLLRRAGQPPQCAACHTAATDGLGRWTASLVLGHGDRRSQSELCLKCHETALDRENTLDPHSVPPQLLARLQHQDPPIRNVSLSLSPPLPQSSSIACATCHHEHQGPGHDLTALTDRACQTCHQKTYHSFATDHPDFGPWPYERRTPIAFDHGAHQAKHFAEKKQPFDCRACHVPDQTSSVQLLASYEVACAKCHDEKIATSVAPGVPMLALPTLDVAALSAAGHDIGSWPALATGDFDGRLPPAMKLLLAADPAAAQAMNVLGPDFDFFDVDARDREQLAACSEIAAAIKRLMTELADSGTTAVARRLSIVAGRELPSNDVKVLVDGLSGDTLNLASSEWLRSAAAGSRNGSPPPSAPGAWFYDGERVAIRYQPTGHADPILTAWLKLSATVAGQDIPFASAMLKDLSRATAPGLCATCHSIDRLPTGRLLVHWQPSDRSAAPRGFTKFSHGPHVLLPELTDCAACHTIHPTADSSKSYANWDPRTFVSDFQPLQRQACATCHTTHAAGDSCQKCHNYHVRVEGLELRARR